MPAIERLSSNLTFPVRKFMTPIKKMKTLFYRLEQQYHRCFYCSCDLQDSSVEITADHVVPKVLSTKKLNFDTPENIVACCKQCNNDKGARVPTESELVRLRELNKVISHEGIDAHFNAIMKMPKYLTQLLPIYSISD